MDVRVSKVIAGCRSGEWLLVSDTSADESIVYRYQVLTNEAVQVIGLSARVTEMVGLQCTATSQQVYVATQGSGQRMVAEALGLGILSVPSAGGPGLFEHLIGEELPRFDLGIVNGGLVGRIRGDSRQFVRAGFVELERYSVDNVSMGITGLSDTSRANQCS